MCAAWVRFLKLTLIPRTIWPLLHAVPLLFAAVPLSLVPHPIVPHALSASVEQTAFELAYILAAIVKCR